MTSSEGIIFMMTKHVYVRLQVACSEDLHAAIMCQKPIAELYFEINTCDWSNDNLYEWER